MPIDVTSIVTIAVTVGGMVVWFIRLEGRVNYNEKITLSHDGQLAEQRQRIQAFDDKIVDKLSEIEKSLARLEGRFQIDQEKKNHKT
jgi:hypothetical protein